MLARSGEVIGPQRGRQEKGQRLETRRRGDGSMRGADSGWTCSTQMSFSRSFFFFWGGFFLWGGFGVGCTATGAAGRGAGRATQAGAGGGTGAVLGRPGCATGAAGGGVAGAAGAGGSAAGLQAGGVCAVAGGRYATVGPTGEEGPPPAPVEIVQPLARAARTRHRGSLVMLYPIRRREALHPSLRPKKAPGLRPGVSAREPARSP